MKSITLELTREEFDCLHEAVDHYVVDTVGDEWDGFYEEEDAEDAEQNFGSLLGKIIEAKKQ